MHARVAIQPSCIDDINLTKSNSLFSPIYYSAMHTTHATRLFLDVTGHVSRTRIHMRVNTFHVVPQQRFCLYFYCNAKSDTAQLQVDEKTSIDLHGIFISSHSFFFFPILIKIWHTIIFNNKLFFFIHEREYLDTQTFFSIRFLLSVWEEVTLPEHPVHTCRMDEKPIGFPIYATQFLPSRGSNEFVTYFALRI